MKILIGRQDGKDNLIVMYDNNKREFGETGSVSQSVSRYKADKNTAHCLLDFNPVSSRLTVVNLNPQNYTWANGVLVTDKPVSITSDTDLVLGGGYYHVPLKEILKAVNYVKPTSIRHLEVVWERYQHDLTELQLENVKQQNQQRLVTILSQMGMLVMLGAGLGMDWIPSWLRGALMVCAVSGSIFFFIRGMNPDKSFVMKKKKLDDQFELQYRCPKCNEFIGMIPYDKLVKTGRCPNSSMCDARYTKLAQ